MANLSLYLDKRSCAKGGLAVIKVLISHNSTTSLFSTKIGIRPEEWNKTKCLVVKRDDADTLNSRIKSIVAVCFDVIADLEDDNRIGFMTATNIRDEFKERFEKSDDEDTSLLIPGFINVMESKNARNREIYAISLKRVMEYVTKYKYVVAEEDLVGLSQKKKNELRQSAYDMMLQDPKVRSMRYDDISYEWLQGFDRKLSETSPSVNARSIIFRCLRHVFKVAQDYGYTQNYPFVRFKIRHEETQKRSLTAEDLRLLFNYQVEPHQQYFLDMFKLIFYFIGINTADLCDLKQISPKGRIEYDRHKTHRHYSIKVEPEAQVIIDRYKGDGHLVNCLNRYKTSQDFMQYTNRHLQEIGPFEWKTSNTRNHLPTKVFNPLFPEITTYWARHTWATIASELDIPKEVISEALGHSMGSRVTAVYINFDLAKVDIANRLVLDWVLYGKYTSWYQAMEDYRKCREQERIEASKIISINQNVV